jgi:hypothetical protein
MHGKTVILVKRIGRENWTWCSGNSRWDSCGNGTYPGNWYQMVEIDEAEATLIQMSGMNSLFLGVQP